MDWRLVTRIFTWLPMYQQKQAYGSNGFPWSSDICHRMSVMPKGICPVAETLHDSTYLGFEMCLHQLSDLEVDAMVCSLQKSLGKYGPVKILMSDDFKQLVGRKVLLRPFSNQDITSEYISWLNDPDVVRYSNQRFVTHMELSSRQFGDLPFQYVESVFQCEPNKGRRLGCRYHDCHMFLFPWTADTGILIGQSQCGVRGSVKMPGTLF